MIDDVTSSHAYDFFELFHRRLQSARGIFFVVCVCCLAFLFAFVFFYRRLFSFCIFKQIQQCKQSMTLLMALQML